ncbi:alpha/beta fold hydrolase [Oleomonas cavernae]|uniref:alpha/beta fold hydrolase n=1 Tax=Oleomonas cavernae TaxID=2320859 RepID=UPI0018F587AE|nr:alpha/beta hydrolase [Oleomonas cavernae]
MDYYSGSGPSIEKLRTFIREYLVYDGSQVPEEVIRQRYEASIDPEVVAAPPLRRPSGLAAAIRMDFTRDRRLAKSTIPTLVLWGTADKVNRPSGGPALQARKPNTDLYLFANTGHWVQWERPEEFNAATAAFLNQQTPAGARR